MGFSCFSCFSSKQSEEDLPANLPRGRLAEKEVDEKAVAEIDAKAEQGKTSSEPTVEQIENKDQTSVDGDVTHPVTVRDFQSTMKSAEKPQPAELASNEVLPLLETTEEPPKSPAATSPSLERPSRGSSLGARRRSKDRSRSRSRSRTRSPKPLTLTTLGDVPPVPKSPRSPLSPTSLTVSDKDKAPETEPSIQNPGHENATDGETTAPPSNTIAESSSAKAPLAEPTPTTPQGPRPDSAVLPLLGDVTSEKSPEDVKDDVKSEARDEPTEKEDATQQTPSQNPPASSSSPVSPVHSPSSFTTPLLPSPTEKKNSSNLEAPMEPQRRISQDSNPALPDDFLASEQKPSDTAQRPSWPLAQPLKISTNSSPITPPPRTALLIPEQTPRPSSRDANTAKSPTTPITATSTTSSRPEVARTQTLPENATTSPTTVAEKRKTRLSRFLTVGAKSKKPSSRESRVPEVPATSPKRMTFSRGSGKESLVKEVQVVGEEVETPDTTVSVTGRTWKNDEDNESLYCY